MALSNFGSAPGAGHLATALFFQDGAIAGNLLYRNAVPGHAELSPDEYHAGHGRQQYRRGRGDL
ncbi:hypothetical protein P4114_31780 [Pseudomonas aeruginosa]|nr:hypothetical protein [Pseudomonas aeruginosa]